MSGHGQFSFDLIGQARWDFLIGQRKKYNLLVVTGGSNNLQRSPRHFFLMFLIFIFPRGPKKVFRLSWAPYIIKRYIKYITKVNFGLKLIKNLIK